MTLTVDDNSNGTGDTDNYNSDRNNNARDNNSNDTDKYISLVMKTVVVTTMTVQ